ncbi:unnamed protein product [Mytilus coruscus]|uniref:Reverse transcriptase domain-containing protein n=1 Tax=Mytilus coruscus TaxID=42192 RepID=A0A6J8EJH1_MYTCO|nr:unnamed protein product [Mytilus coruscus]
MAFLIHLLPPSQQDLLATEKYNPNGRGVDVEDLNAMNKRFYQPSCTVVNRLTPAGTEGGSCGPQQKVKETEDTFSAALAEKEVGLPQEELNSSMSSCEEVPMEKRHIVILQSGEERQMIPTHSLRDSAWWLKSDSLAEKRPSYIIRTLVKTKTHETVDNIYEPMNEQNEMCKNDVSVDVVIENRNNENVDSRKRKIVISDENCNDDNVEVVCQTEMNDVISSCEVNDTGRDEHIDNKKKRRLSFCRMLSSNVQNVSYNETSFSDHTYVIMNFNCCTVEKGPGLWVLNNTLLHNNEYVQKVRNIINEAVQSSLYTVEPLVWWDNLKFRIKKFSQVFSVNLAKEKKKEFFNLQNKIQRLCAMQADDIGIDVTKLENLKLELNNYELEKCKGAVLRSKAIWASEKDNVKMDEFISSVDVKINQNDKEMCDAEILYDEITEALMAMSKNKSPGTDGLTTEFYCKFYDCLRNILCHVYNSIYDENILSRSMRAGVLSLIIRRKQFGFGDVFIKWIEIFYTRINSCIKCNGSLTPYFCVDNGIRQGSPISALLYVLAAEPLQCNIMKNVNISGIKIPNTTDEALIFQHTDDTTLTVSDKSSIDEILKVFEMYEASSGAKINRQKSEILPIGKGRITDIEKKNKYKLQVCENYILLLGVYVGKDKTVCDHLNWSGKRCYEVIEGFLPEMAIVEMIQNVTNHCDINNIVKRFNILKVILPKEWTEIIQKNVHRRNVSRSININVIFKDKLSEFSMCSTKEFYLLLTSKLCQHPICYKKWTEVFEIEENDLCKVWKNVNFYWKPSILMDLDFKIAHYCIFTNSKLMTMKLINYNVCEEEVENITHLFLLCSELVEFHLFLQQKLSVLFDHVDSDKINNVVYEAVFMFGLIGSFKGVNVSFVNFMLSIARYCIFRRRNLLKNLNSNVDLIRLFKYTVKHYITYLYEYV